MQHLKAGISQQLLSPAKRKPKSQFALTGIKYHNPTTNNKHYISNFDKQKSKISIVE